MLFNFTVNTILSETKRWLDRRPSAYTTMRYTNRQPLPLPFYL